MTEPVDPRRVAAALDDAGRRLAGLLDEAGDPDATVAGMTRWTVGDLARHVAILPDYYRSAPEGTWGWTPDADGMAATNAANLAHLEGRSVPECAAHLRATLPPYLEDLRAAPVRGTRYPAHAGVAMTPAELGAVGIAEWEVHGLDLARTLGRPWTIPAEHAALVLAGVEVLLPRWLDGERAAGHTAAYEIRLRGGGTHRWRFTGGALDCDPPEPWRPDAVIWGDPVALLLVFYRRRPQWQAIAAGQLLAGGRRPWLALSLAGRFHAP